MKFSVGDKAGYTLAEGRMEKNRAEARALVDKISRQIEIERLVKASRRARPTPAADLHQRARTLDAPMATPKRAVGLFWAVSALAIALVGAFNVGGRS